MLAEFWMNLQMTYDSANAEKALLVRVKNRVSNKQERADMIGETDDGGSFVHLVK